MPAFESYCTGILPSAHHERFYKDNRKTRLKESRLDTLGIIDTHTCSLVDQDSVAPFKSLSGW